MGDDDAFLAAVRAEPDADLTRLVYADWLDERGDPRGEFLRLECRLHATPESDPDYRSLQRQLGDLGRPLDVRWVAAVCRVHAEYGPPHIHPHRHPLNVDGTFYTTGRCLSCEAPEAEAPDLLAPQGAGNYTTYFVRRPVTAAEIEEACSACTVCCMSDLRYGGTDPRVIARLGNDPQFCDNLLSGDSSTLVPARLELREPSE